MPAYSIRTAETRVIRGNYEVEAENGQEALQKFHAGDYTVVEEKIIDIPNSQVVDVEKID
jgi:hypothetical protein